MRKATAISAGLHAAVLLWATLTFTGKTLEATPPESLPVDLVSDKDFSEITKGIKDAKKVETPKPLVEKKTEEPPKPTEDSKPKITEKKEIQAQKEVSQPPEPQPPKPDPIAEKIKQQEEPKQAKVEPQPLPPKRPPQKPQPKFDANRIAALLDKRDPQRNAAAGAEMNPTASLGAESGTAAQLSQSEIDALRARLRQCWNPPVGAADAANHHVVFRVLFNRNGTIASNPILVGGPPSQIGPVLAESARRALLQCQPYTMLRPEHYDQWRDMQITFDPRDMFGG